MQEYRSWKLQGSITRTSLQIDLQILFSTKSDLLVTKMEKMLFSQKFEIQGFIISATNCFAINAYENMIKPMKHKVL